MTHVNQHPDPQLDLVLERIIDLSPEDLKHWFRSAPWSTVDCEIDLRPGGLYADEASKKSTRKWGLPRGGTRGLISWWPT